MVSKARTIAAAVAVAATLGAVSTAHAEDIRIGTTTVPALGPTLPDGSLTVSLETMLDQGLITDPDEVAAAKAALDRIASMTDAERASWKVAAQSSGYSEARI